jgi:GTPase
MNFLKCKPEIRIATIGNVDSAKSTTISVIKNDIRDDGRGFARNKILKYKHEYNTGRTSSITQSFIENNDKIIDFIDLAGHEKYLKTTITGLNGFNINYAMITIGSDRGIIGMTKEHIALAVSLTIPIFIVITKLDIAKKHKLNKIKNNILKILNHKIISKKPIYVTNENINYIINNYSNNCDFIPIFEISNISGMNINILKQFIYTLKNNHINTQSNSTDILFKIDDKFKVTGIGTVISGFMNKGTINKNDQLYIGPFQGNFIKVIVKSIHDNFKKEINFLQSGQSGCFNIKSVNKKNILYYNRIKKGLILTNQPKSITKFEANITILHHPTTIKENYQPVIHCGTVRQTAKICKMSKNLVRTGDSATVLFEFLFHPEYLELNSKLVFREGNTKGIGKIIKIY